MMKTSVCLNVEDPRMKKLSGEQLCTASQVDRWTMRWPRPDSPNAVRAANATALRDAVQALGSGTIGGNHQQEVSFAGGVTGEVCTEPVLIQVPLRAPQRRGRVLLRMSAESPGSPPDRDYLNLICLPS